MLRRTLPVVESAPTRRGPDRSTDRRIAFAGVVTAGAFLGLALASLLLPPAARLGWWLPAHLVLAGAAGTAIAAMVPFFAAALAIASPAPAWLRGGSIALVAGGATLAAVGHALDPAIPSPLATSGAVAFVAGMAAAAAATFLPLRRPAGPRRPATEAAYGLALLAVLAGVSLAGLYLAGVPGVTAAWGRLRVAHAWLNTFGFLAIAVAGTLIHFAPTVSGARIRARRSGGVAIGLLAAGVTLGVAGYVLAADWLVRGGVAALASGAAALGWHGLTVARGGAAWSGDRGWHRFTTWSLAAAPAWLLVTAVLVGARAVPSGADATGWSLGSVVAPLAAGFAVQVLLGAMVHLVPVIGPGGPERHAAMRATLGRYGAGRVLTWNLGVAVATLGLAPAAGAAADAGVAAVATLAGAAILALALGTNLVLLALGLLHRG